MTTAAATKNNKAGPAKVQSHRGGRREGTKNYCKAEIRALILVVKEIVPLEPGEWEYVAEKHAKKWPGRDSNSIRRKCKALLKKARSDKFPRYAIYTKMLKMIDDEIAYKRQYGASSYVVGEQENCTPNTTEQENQLKQGSGYFSKAEIGDLLFAALEMSPFKLERLASIHVQKWPDRDSKSIRKKYLELAELADWPTSTRQDSDKTLQHPPTAPQQESATAIDAGTAATKEDRMDEDKNEVAWSTDEVEGPEEMLPGATIASQTADNGDSQHHRNYSEAETRDLLLAMQIVLPIARYQWEYLAHTHAKKWSFREVESIRRKFHALLDQDSLKPSADRSWESRMASHVMFGIYDKDEWGHNPQLYKKFKAVWSAQAPEGASVENERIALEENEDFAVISDSMLSEDECDSCFPVSRLF